jgi:hypothetical protein
MAGCFVTLAFLPPGMPAVAQLFFTGAIVFSGLNCVGVIKSCQLVSFLFDFHYTNRKHTLNDMLLVSVVEIHQLINPY